MATFTLKSQPTVPGWRLYKVGFDRLGAALPVKTPLNALDQLKVYEVPYTRKFPSGTDWAPRGMGKMNG